MVKTSIVWDHHYKKENRIYRYGNHLILWTFSIHNLRDRDKLTLSTAIFDIN